MDVRTAQTTDLERRREILVDRLGLGLGNKSGYSSLGEFLNGRLDTPRYRELVKANLKSADKIELEVINKELERRAANAEALESNLRYTEARNA